MEDLITKWKIKKGKGKELLHLGGRMKTMGERTEERI